jgi:phage/plasmid-like protein (TIGR03299 family)
MSIDVNQAFAIERAGQLQDARDRQSNIDQRVASGRLVPLGNDRFRVNEPGTWDNGEVLRLSAGQLLPQHGLDLTTGDAALYSAVPAWHGLGNIIPGGISDIDEVLRLGGIGYEVEKRAARYTFDGDIRTAPEHFVTVRDDTGAALGVVGTRYEVIQNRSLFTFLEDLVAEHGVIWESAGALRDGKRVFVSMRLPKSVIVDPGGLDDEIILFIAAINSHDGRSKAETVLSPWRPVCGNTERFAVRDAKARWGIRHTSGALDRIMEARRTLGLSVKYGDQFAAEETALARTDLAVAEFHKVITDLWAKDDEDEDSARAKGIAERRLEVLDTMFRAEADRAGRTAYAAERAITDYLDHVAPRRPGKTMTEEIARATALLEGADDDRKNKAHRRLMTLTLN